MHIEIETTNQPFETQKVNEVTPQQLKEVETNKLIENTAQIICKDIVAQEQSSIPDEKEQKISNEA